MTDTWTNGFNQWATQDHLKAAIAKYAGGQSPRDCTGAQLEALHEQFGINHETTDLLIDDAFWSRTNIVKTLDRMFKTNRCLQFLFGISGGFTAASLYFWWVVDTEGISFLNNGGFMGITLTMGVLTVVLHQLWVTTKP